MVTRRIRTLLILPAFLAVTLAALWPIVSRFSSAIPSSGAAFDPVFQAFLLGWDWQALSTAPGTVFQAPIFYPEPRTLTYMDPMLGEAIAASPVFLAHGTVPAAYNFLVLLSFVVSAWATYRLTRLFGVSRLGAFLAGTAFAFSPYRLANLDLLNQLQTQFLVLGLFFATRYVQRWKRRDAACALATLATQVYFGWYYSYYLLLCFLAIAVYAWVAKLGPAPRAHWKFLAAAAGFSLLAVLPVAWPYILEHRSMPGFRRTLGESALYSADLFDYFRWSARSFLTQLLGLPQGNQSYAPGLVAMVLGSLGAWSIARGVREDRTRLKPLPLALALVGFVLSLGPILHIAGHRIWIPLPYAILHFVIPGFSSMRAPARLAVVVALAFAVLAGIGYSYLEGVLQARRLPWRGLVAILLLVTAASVIVRPISMTTLPGPNEMPPAYRWIATHPGGPLLELPAPLTDGDENEGHALRQYFVLFHKRPRLDGVSGFLSAAYREFRRTIQSFPNDAALASAESKGARLILIHFEDYNPRERQALESRIRSTPRLVARARFGGDVIYSLEP